MRGERVMAVKGKSLAALGVMELAVALFFVAAAYLYAVYFGLQGATRSYSGWLSRSRRFSAVSQCTCF